MHHYQFKKRSFLLGFCFDVDILDAIATTTLDNKAIIMLDAYPKHFAATCDSQVRLIQSV